LTSAKIISIEDLHHFQNLKIFPKLKGIIVASLLKYRVPPGVVLINPNFRNNFPLYLDNREAYAVRADVKVGKPPRGHPCSHNLVADTIKMLSHLCRKKTNDFVIIVQKILPFDKEGVSMLLPNGDIYIETVIGDMNKLVKGEMFGSYYQVDSSFHVVKAHEILQDEVYFISQEGKIKKRKIKPSKVVLTESQLRSLVLMVINVSKKFEKCVIEWGIMNNKLYILHIKPVTVNEMDFADDAYRVISPGHVIGVVTFLDTSPLKFVSNFNSIIVAPFPDIRYTDLLNDASAFIFEKGSVLCHLAIDIRERRIPAVVVPRACKKFRNGDILEINTYKKVLRVIKKSYS